VAVKLLRNSAGYLLRHHDDLESLTWVKDENEAAKFAWGLCPKWEEKIQLRYVCAHTAMSMREAQQRNVNMRFWRKTPAHPPLQGKPSRSVTGATQRRAPIWRRTSRPCRKFDVQKRTSLENQGEGRMGG
jgi:hypothetical protein